MSKVVPISPEAVPEKNGDDMIVTLRVSQLRALIREELAALNGHSELFTPEELAERMKLPVSWVYEQSRQGNIPTHRLGRYLRFSLVEVLESQKKKQETP
jgi:excisionase family DNA binding protein